MEYEIKWNNMPPKKSYMEKLEIHEEIPSITSFEVKYFLNKGSMLSP